MRVVLAAAAAALCVVCVVATPQLLRDSPFRGWQKRLDQVPANSDDFATDFQHHLPQISAANSQLMLRSPRGQRQYDVPQIECPPAADGMERFACPTPDRQGRYHCIDDHVLCDGFIDCPSAEDEDRQACMFYKTTKAHLDVLADALLRWARGR
ncbi:low-density lipoprotein receptor domain-containing jelly belly protein [Rhynchophorus ferrugineus]|uniref:low-density lipoprotein receptor domain-containing jelly belly protein n=1 Tax=Rhynchophorus ferrugineus TaxID=354439 RepID=UPI003FCCF4ED